MAYKLQQLPEDLKEKCHRMEHQELVIKTLTANFQIPLTPTRSSHFVAFYWWERLTEQDNVLLEMRKVDK